MSEGPAKIYIRVESDSEQKNAVKTSRKTLKIIQKTADKENLIGRQTLLSVKDRLIKSEELNDAKRIKVTSQASQTEQSTNTTGNSDGVKIDDLTADNPSEAYWETLAEKRREALEETLNENRQLHEKIESLEDELDTSRKMLEETRNLVEVLTEMLQERDEEVDEITSTADAVNDEEANIEEEESQL